MVSAMSFFLYLYRKMLVTYYLLQLAIPEVIAKPHIAYYISNKCDILTLTAYYGSIFIELVATNIFVNMLTEGKVRLL